MRREGVEFMTLRIDVHHHISQRRQRVKKFVAHLFGNLVALHNGQVSRYVDIQFGALSMTQPAHGNLAHR